MSEKPDTKELIRLADDGCPHVETVDEIAANIPHFVNASGPKTYCLFIPFTPTILRCMIGAQYCVNIEPFTLNGKSGSMVETMCENDIVGLWRRFYQNHESQQENCDGEEERT